MNDVTPTNFCRQVVAQFSRQLQDMRPDDHRCQPMKLAIQLCGLSVKFILPNGGRVLDDRDLRAFGDDQPLRLPFPAIALEYTSIHDARIHGAKCALPENYMRVSKHVVLAIETEDGIRLLPVFWIDHLSTWAAIPECLLLARGWADRTIKDPNGNFGKRAKFVAGIPKEDYDDEIGALLDFLNALQCSNVHIELGAPARPQRKKVSKTALPFDEYHLLTIDVLGVDGARGDLHGDRRSPREHLRRGHIRRYQNGLRVWVNATVVNPGHGSGQVTKDYKLKAGHGEQS